MEVVTAGEAGGTGGRLGATSESGATGALYLGSDSLRQVADACPGATDLRATLAITARRSSSAEMGL